MKTFHDISMYDGKDGVACVIGVENLALDVSGSSEFRQGEKWLKEQCGSTVASDANILKRLSTFRIMGRLVH